VTLEALPPDVVPVIAAVVEREGRYLVARRPPEKRHGGMWEFPGGKVREGEGLLDAVARELGEELGVGVRRLGKERFRARDPGSAFLILFVEVELRGEPRPLEHTALRWAVPAELARLDLAPSDRRFVWEALLPPD
jgi:8-oxo-dGTP diphosphatase